MSTPAIAIEHLEHAQWDQAMDALLAAWRRHRAVELERAIVSLSDYLATGMEELDVEEDDWQVTWQTRAKRKRAIDLAVLLPRVTELPKGGIPRRVRMALAYGPDPRVGRLLVEIIEQPPLTASSNFSMWTEIFAALPAYVDACARRKLRARAKVRGGKSQFWTKLERWIESALPKLPKQAKLPPEWVDDLAHLEYVFGELDELGPPELSALAAQLELEHDEGGSLAAAREALAADELELALDQLVGAWAHSRDASVAACIERLARFVDAQHEGPADPTTRGFHEAWMRAGERPRPCAIGPLLASLRVGKLVDVEARIEVMSDWRPDPRVAQAMVVLTQDYMLGARDRLWAAVYDALVRHADPRVSDQVSARHARLINSRVLHRHRSEGRAVRRTYEAFMQACAVQPLERSEGAALEHIEVKLAELVAQHQADPGELELEHSMVREILADWDGDGPRQVYSDWLQARDDPRGQFIALELALARGGRVQGKRDKYFKTHEAALFGPLTRLRGWGHGFERGLLTTLKITTRKGALNISRDDREELWADLRWATIRTLQTSYDDELAELFARAPLWSLERLERPGFQQLLGFGEREDPVPLRELELSATPDIPARDWQRLDALAPVLPRLESLEIMIWGRLGGRVTPPHAFFASRLTAGLKQLRNGDESSGGVARIDQWIARMVSARCPVPLLRVIGPELSVDARQIEPGVFELDMRISLRSDDEYAAVVLEALAGLGRSHVRELRLTIGRVHDDVQPRLEAGLAGLPVVMVT